MRDERLNFENLLEHLGQAVRGPLKTLAETNIGELREIRLTVERPMQAVYRDRIRFIGKDGKDCGEYSEKNRLTIGEIQESFAAVCEYSVHTYKNEICGGFVTVEGGNRVGICGTAVYEKEKIINVKDISSLNIRISHEIFGAADPVFEALRNNGMGGILIAGPPCSGKTTMLRDFARQAGNGNFGMRCHVNIVDERMEIAGVYRGVPSFDVGSTTTVLNGYMKSDGIISAVRSMAPDFIVCDEFGGDKDVAASLYAMKSGVLIAASMHTFDEDELIKKQSFVITAEAGIFKWVVFMDKNCSVSKIIRAQELLK